MRCMAYALALWVVLSAVGAEAGTSEWTRVQCPVADPLHNGFFVDDTRGWVISYGTGVVLRTDDGGDTWSVAARLDSLFYESLFFLDRSQGWICGEGGTLLRTEDGGGTWTPTRVAPEHIAFYGIFFRDARHALLVGMNVEERRGVLLDSFDGGLEWRSHPDSLAGAFYEPIQFVGENLGFIGGGRFVLRTTDGGRNWKGVDTGDDIMIRGIHFIDGQRGWAVGHSGAVVRTEDGGLSWKKIDRFTRNRLRSVCFIDGHNGFIVGDADQEPGSLWLTKDAGATWTKAAGNLSDLHRLFPGAGGIWAVGKSGTILRCGARECQGEHGSRPRQ